MIKKSGVARLLAALSLAGTARAAEQTITFKSGAADQGSGLLVTPTARARSLPSS